MLSYLPKFFIMKSFTESSQVDCVYLDSGKEFDKVIHFLLIAELRGHVICRPLLQRMRSYLKDCVPIFKCDGGCSRPFPVTLGVSVSQGSHPSHLLLIRDHPSLAINMLCSYQCLL